MTIFIKANSYDMWSVYQKGDYTPVDSAAPTEPEKRKLELNAKALNMLYCALDSNEYNKISSCDTAKQAWDTLVVTYEGTNQVKECKINYLVREYELFAMLSYESISEMFARFTDITNALKSLGKVYSNAENVSKILRSLPKKWEAKVTAIQEAKDLTKLKLEELLGSLMTHEINVQGHEEKKEKKSLALKSTKAVHGDDESEDGNESELLQKFRKYMKKKLKKKMKSHRRRNDDSNDESGDESEEEQLKNVRCYECNKKGHLRPNCPNRRKDDSKQKKKALKATWDQEDESESDDNSIENVKANICLMAKDDEETTHWDNLSVKEKVQCFMAREENEVLSPHSISNSSSQFIAHTSDDETESEFDLEEAFEELMINYKNLGAKHKALKKECKVMTSNHQLEKEELAQTLRSLDKEYSILEESSEALKDELEGAKKKWILEKENLTTITKSLENENAILKKSNEILEDKISNACSTFASNQNDKNKIDYLKKKVEDLTRTVIKFTNGTNNLNMLLGNQRCTFRKRGVGYNPHNKPRNYKNFFEKRESSNYPHKVCNYCGRTGHVSYSCHFRNYSNVNAKTKMIWVKKGDNLPTTNPIGPKQVWVPKSKC